jgi:hypothetical protein
LKSPPKHHGLSHQLIKPAISSHNTLLSPSSLGPYKPPNAHKKLSLTSLSKIHFLIIEQHYRCI